MALSSARSISAGSLTSNAQFAKIGTQIESASGQFEHYSPFVEMATSVGRETDAKSVTALLTAGQGVMLAGPAGVGKTHLAALVAARLERDGWHVVRLFGGPAMQTVHLGAAQSILSSAMARTPEELYANVERELRRLAGSAAPLILVDDIDQVDAASAALLEQLCRAGIAVLATLRAEGVTVPFVLGLWSDGLLERLDINPLVESDSNALIDMMLEARVGQLIHHEVFALAGGNPLLTRELIADARQSGALVEQDGDWDLAGSIRAEQRVSDLFAARLDALDSEHRETLELVALAEMLPVELVKGLSSENTLEKLQELDLIEVVDAQVRCSHPLLGEVAHRMVPSLRADRLVGLLIAAILASPVSSSQDVLRATRWQLRRGEAPTPATAAAAAESAMAVFDGATARRCAEVAFVSDSAASHVLLGRALFIEQDLEAALGMFRSGAELVNTDAERATTAVALSEALVFGMGDFAGASIVLERAIDTVIDPSQRAMVASSLGLVRGLTGDLSAALSYGDELLDFPDIEPETRLRLAVMWTLAAAATGRFKLLQRRLDEALELALELRARVPVAVDQILATQVLFDSADGRLPEAIRLAKELRREAERNHWSTAIWDQCLAEAELLAGRGACAMEHATQAVASDSAGDLIGIRSLGLARQAVVAACLGDLPLAKRAFDLSLADPRCGPREQSSLGRARANVLALEGDLDGAVEEVLARALKTGDNLIWAAITLYDAVRFGRAADVATYLRSIASRAPAELVMAMNDHCKGVVAGDAGLLAEAAERLRRAGLVHFAAEAMAHAAGQLAVDGKSSAASLTALRSFALFDRCDGLRSLAIEELERPLTNREYEVASAAGGGKTSQEIANDLFVSRRTVDNHLQNTYRKLGINQREELADVFGI